MLDVVLSFDVEDFHSIVARLWFDKIINPTTAVAANTERILV